MSEVRQANTSITFGESSVRKKKRLPKILQKRLSCFSNQSKLRSSWQGNRSNGKQIIDNIARSNDWAISKANLLYAVKNECELLSLLLLLNSLLLFIIWLIWLESICWRSWSNNVEQWIQSEDDWASNRWAEKTLLIQGTTDLTTT